MIVVRICRWILLSAQLIRHPHIIRYGRRWSRIRHLVDGMRMVSRHRGRRLQERMVIDYIGTRISTAESGLLGDLLIGIGFISENLCGTGTLKLLPRSITLSSGSNDNCTASPG
jgi:hypothetical protein